MAAPRPFIVRLLAGSAGVIVSLIAVLSSLGAAIAAPFGMYFVARWARRRNREPNRIASLFGAVAAASVVGAVVWGLIFSLMPRPTEDQLNTAVTESQARAKLPAWYTKMFPQAARTDSASQRLMRSPQFVKTVMILSAAIMGVLLGVIGGALTWCASLLLRFARSGPAPAPPPEYS